MQSEIKCTTQIPEILGLEKDTLTVGRHFYLNCEGLWDKEFDFSKAFAVVDENSKNTIKVFKIEARNSNSFDVDMILYVAGELKTTNFKISDGVREIDLGAQSFTVQSVIDQKTEKPPEPFGYIVSELQWPWQYSVIAVLIFIIVIGSLLAQILNKMKWRGRIDRLRQYDSPLPADSQFYKEIRKSEKKEFPISDIEKHCKQYILRIYQVPIFELSNRQIISYIKKKYPRLKTERRQIFNLLQDIRILQKDSNIDKRKKFVEQCYRFVDATEDLKSRGQL